jgi:triosephosphate isomerase (TIM)
MARKKFLMGNWKMNLTIAEADSFCEAVRTSGLVKEARTKGVMLGIAPSYIALCSARKHAHGLIIAAQDCHYADHGAYTSSVSIPMLQEIGVEWSLVGHSEKRTYEGETSFTCNRKIKALVKAGFHVVYCVGETSKEYDEGITKDVIAAQIGTGLLGLTKDEMSSLVIAYEPVWSIGTGKNASSAIAEDICAYIRSLIEERFGKVAGTKVQILYGGSVKPENIREYLAQADVDGALVGGASLKADSFKALLENI